MRRGLGALVAVCAAAVCCAPAGAATWSPTLDTGIFPPQSPGELAFGLTPGSLLVLATSAKAEDGVSEYDFASGAPSRRLAAPARSYSPVMAVNDSGDVAVAWVAMPEDESAPNELFVSTRAHGGEFTAPQRVSAADRSAQAAHLAVGPDGDVLLVFVSSRRRAGRTDVEAFADGFRSVEYASAHAGSAFPAPKRLSRAGVYSHSPRLDCDDAGRCLAAWVARRGEAQRGIDVARVTTSGKRRAVQVLRRPARSPFSRLSRLVVDGAGRALVAFKVQRYNTFYRTLRLGYAQGSTRDGLGRPRLIPDTGRAGAPAVALGAGDTPLIVWQAPSAGGGWKLTSNRRTVIAAGRKRFSYGVATVGDSPEVVFSGGSTAGDRRLRLATPRGRDVRIVGRAPTPGDFVSFRFRGDGHGRLITLATSEKTGDEGLVATVVRRNGRPDPPVELARSDPPRNSGFEISNVHLLVSGERVVALWTQRSFDPADYRFFASVLQSP